MHSLEVFSREAFEFRVKAAVAQHAHLMATLADGVLRVWFGVPCRVQPAYDAWDTRVDSMGKNLLATIEMERNERVKLHETLQVIFPQGWVEFGSSRGFVRLFLEGKE